MYRRYQLIIFDWDGTLMDSTDKIVRCFQNAALDCQVDVPSADAVKDIIGLGLREAIASLFPTMSEDKKRQVMDRYREYFTGLDETEMPLFPGVRLGLQELHQRGHQLAVATGKARRGLQRVLNDTDTTHLFAATRCVDEAVSKPDPRMVLDLLRLTNIEADAALMVGDTVYDMQMAKRAGIAAVAVSYGVHHPERLLAEEPLACLDSFRDVCDWIH